jgi:hypothetical protein
VVNDHKRLAGELSVHETESYNAGSEFLQMIYLIFNDLGLGMIIFCVLVGFALNYFGVSSDVSGGIGLALLFLFFDFSSRWNNHREHKWKRFFFPSTGGQLFFVPCWCLASFFMWGLTVSTAKESRITDVERAKRSITDMELSLERQRKKQGQNPMMAKKGTRQIEGSVDPWGNPYNFEYPNTRFPNDDRAAIWSNGPNGKDENGGGDDIKNWTDPVARPAGAHVSDIDGAKKDVANIEESAEKYKRKHGKYQWKKGTQHFDGMLDPWGYRYNIEFPSSRFPDGSRVAIWSNGPNERNEQGEGDDINNWSDPVK